MAETGLLLPLPQPRGGEPIGSEVDAVATAREGEEDQKRGAVLNDTSICFFAVIVHSVPHHARVILHTIKR